MGALRSLLEQVPLIVDVPGLLAHWRWFGEWSLGCIGVLSDWIVETVDALYQQGATTLTIDALQKHALPSNVRARMESEARAGEFKWEQAKAQSEQELKRLLGNPAPIPGTAPSRSPAENMTQNVSGHAPVERAAARDAVGDQVQTAKTPKCTFSGVVPIETRHFLDSGTRLVECPDCAAMRSLDLQKGVLRFKSHDRRKTTTPNTEERWARVDLVWDVMKG